MKPPASILLVITRRIGDVLLATPLIESIAEAWAGTAIDMLVFHGTESVVQAHPRVRRVIAVRERPGILQHIVFIADLWNRYDAAVSLVPGDRPTIYAWAAGRWRAGVLIDEVQQHWKRRLLDRWADFDGLNTHTVRTHLALADILGIAPRARVVPAWQPRHEAELAAAAGFDTTHTAFAVLHVFPKFNYKMWHADGWAALAQHLAARSLRIVLTGGSDTEELQYVQRIAAALPADTVNLAGKISLPAASCLAGRSRIYVGPDTAMTHIAAALGVPVLALFGPTNAVKWGPWPRGHPASENPWQRCGTQCRGNVILLQGTGACVPCHLEGCERHISSLSDCLQQLSAARVIHAAERLLDARYNAPA